MIPMIMNTKIKTTKAAILKHHLKTGKTHGSGFSSVSEVRVDFSEISLSDCRGISRLYVTVLVEYFLPSSLISIFRSFTCFPGRLLWSSIPFDCGFALVSFENCLFRKFVLSWLSSDPQKMFKGIESPWRLLSADIVWL